MGPITRELLQNGLLEYLTIMVLFEPDKKSAQEERGAFVIEPKDIVNVFSREEYLRLYKANEGVLARMIISPEVKRRELGYAIHGAHLRVRREYELRDCGA